MESVNLGATNSVMASNGRYHSNSLGVKILQGLKSVGDKSIMSAETEFEVTERLRLTNQRARAAYASAGQLAIRAREMDEQAKKLELFFNQVEERASKLHRRIATMNTRK